DCLVCPTGDNSLAVPAEGYTGHTQSMASDDELLLTAVRVPDPYGPVGTGRGQALPIPAARQATEAPSVRLESENLLAIRRVPDIHITGRASREQTFAIRAEQHTDQIILDRQRKFFLAVRRVPDAERVVPAGRSQSLAIGAKSHAGDFALVPF